MGCVASRLEQEEEVVSICRERKNQLKLAVERRYALADAHYRYCQSLFGVSAAINLFVARHSSPPTPFYITFPPPSPPKENVVSNPLFLQQAPSEPTKKAIACEPCTSSTSSISPRKSVRRRMRMRMRKRKKKNKFVVESGNVSQGEQQVEKGLTVIDTPVRGRELLEALKDIEDHFIRAYDSGKDVSRMLECNRVHVQSNLEEIKESSTKLIQAITWRSASRSSSCKSLVATGPKSSSTWKEFNNDLFDDYGGMASGSHSLTLGRLYAWEKKLYEEVKDGDSIRRIYERKCNHLRNQDVRGDEGLTVDKTRAAVKDLYSRILVAIRSAETISNQIDKLRDEELEPQMRELLQGMMGTWKIMLESHEIQNKIIFEVKTFTCPSYGKFCNESHRLATLQLETELVNWRACFMEYIAAQKGYIEALHGWLSKFVAPEVEFYSRGRNSAPPCQSNGPPLLKVCHDWLDSMNKLPDKAVSFAIKSCAKDVRALWLQQGVEQQQKRKVDSLSKELDKKIIAFQKADNRISEFALTEKIAELEMDHQAQSLVERKDMLEIFRKRIDIEKEKHHNCMQETERITLNGFQTGFCRVFESMTEFSRAVLKMYNDLSTIQNAEKLGNHHLV
ncbi:UNVERIFIED_CONTAM: protein ALTERED PHOSPHATE STARVATION RESPONSE 1 [Sesamum radiatum]|uniref:Protein ALTERED PHOSPHATE STARVATION RESPONSE 1 n=1 Tax=Sesamum radiatum TaxID=300843 RepID=A0AAW2MSU5_SESRA